jgi:hypothetical protein
VGEQFRRQALIVVAAALLLLAVLPARGQVATTYRGAVFHFVVTGVAGDVYCLRGSGIKNVRLLSLDVSAVAAAAVVADVGVIMRSPPDTGGNAVSVTMVPSDPSQPATALANAYVDPPTAGTSVGTIAAQKLAVGTARNTAPVGIARFNFGEIGQPIILHAAEALCVNITALGAGASVDIDSVHTED